MKKLKHLILGFFLVAGLAAGASAQKNDKPKPPPKEKPPTVKPGGEKPPPPREGNRPKKPGSGFALVWRDEQSFTA